VQFRMDCCLTNSPLKGVKMFGTVFSQAKDVATIGCAIFLSVFQSALSDLAMSTV
jgi:hypothetical protein